MKKHILKKIDEAIASDETSEKNKILFEEAKNKLIQAKTENKIIKIVAVVIRIMTGLFEDD